MAVIDVDQVQQWLASTKYPIEELDEILEETARAVVFSGLEARFDTTSWVDESTTPQLVQVVIALLVAAWTYQRLVGEDVNEGDNYGATLEQRAHTLLKGILDSVIDVGVEPDPDLVAGRSVSFFPTDDEDEDEDFQRRFTIGQVF